MFMASLSNALSTFRKRCRSSSNSFASAVQSKKTQQQSYTNGVVIKYGLCVEIIANPTNQIWRYDECNKNWLERWLSCSITIIAIARLGTYNHGTLIRYNFIMIRTVLCIVLSIFVSFIPVSDEFRSRKKASVFGIDFIAIQVV